MPPYTILHSECSTGWGGQELRIWTEMNAMRSRGHRLLLAAPSKTEIYKRCCKAGFEVFDFSSSSLFYPWSILRLAFLLKKKRVEIVNTHSSRDGWIVGIAARLARVPFLIRSRHIDVEYKGKTSSRIAFCKLPDLVITTSERIRQKLIEALKLNPEKVHTMPTGIDIERFLPCSEKEKEAARAKFGLNPHSKLVGVVAVLRSWKGHSYFLKAAAQLIQKRDNIDFILAGNGPKRAEIERQIQELKLGERVHLVGHVEQVENIIAALDIVVLPSTAHEGIPQSLLQAMAMQKPVIGTDVGGIPEIVEHERTGLIVSAKNSQALAESIERLLEDQQLANALAYAGCYKIKSHYSIQTMCEKLEKIYASAS